ncbi:MAG: DUF362 domain-containing protein [Thermoguttaceae bacterium]|jgi:uncharacterized protein (DUF362 family)
MGQNCSRREFLVSSLGTTGFLAAGGLSFAETAEKVYYPSVNRPTTLPTAPVAIERCRTYDPAVLREKLNAGFNLIGGLKKLVSNKTVSIKVNVTGGPGTLADLPGYRTYQIHPNLLAALCAALNDAGARRMIVLESQYSPKSPEEVLTASGWDIRAIQSAGGNRVTFQDTRNRGKWPQYSRLKVPWGGFLFPSFDVNPSYEKTDVFISLAKLKDHLSAGVTLSIKNLFGMTPTSLYGDNAPNEDSLSNRGSVLHNGMAAVAAGVPKEISQHVPVVWNYRVPRVTADCLGARPIDLAVIDGIETTRAGEGPWAAKAQPIQPGLLLVGRHPLCTDAIATAAMGYDPLAEHFKFPFPSENHLRLLYSVGVGEIDPKKIEVRGLPLKEAVYPFNPKHEQLDTPTAYYAHYDSRLRV